MSNEAVFALRDVLTSKHGPVYMGLVSITILVAIEILAENKYSISHCENNIAPTSPLELTTELTKTSEEECME